MERPGLKVWILEPKGSFQPEIVDGESARNNVFAEEVGDGARVAGSKGGVGGSEESGGTGPGHGGGGFGERGCDGGELVVAKMGEDRHATRVTASCREVAMGVRERNGRVKLNQGKGYLKETASL
jgi:hypothetical protein